LRHISLWECDGLIERTNGEDSTHSNRLLFSLQQNIQIDNTLRRLNDFGDIDNDVARDSEEDLRNDYHYYFLATSSNSDFRVLSMQKILIYWSLFSDNGFGMTPTEAKQRRLSFQCPLSSRSCAKETFAHLPTSPSSARGREVHDRSSYQCSVSGNGWGAYDIMSDLEFVGVDSSSSNGLESTTLQYSIHPDCLPTFKIYQQRNANDSSAIFVRFIRLRYQLPRSIHLSIVNEMLINMAAVVPFVHMNVMDLIKHLKKRYEVQEGSYPALTDKQLNDQNNFLSFIARYRVETNISEVDKPP
jgi:hypothetical protein